MILGFLLTALYIPGIAGAATTPRWALLAVALPIILLFRGGVEGHAPLQAASTSSNQRYTAVGKFLANTSGSVMSGLAGFEPGPRFTLAHLFGLGFITWAATSLIWTPNRLDGWGELAKLLILAQAFVLGQRLVSLHSLLIGMAMGLCLSSILLLVQFGYPDIILHMTTHSGLFINSGSLAEIAALILIGLVYEFYINNDWGVVRIRGADVAHPRRYCFGLGISLLPCIVLPASRGAGLALTAAFTVWLWSKSRLSALALITLAAVVLGSSLWLGFHIASVEQRLGMWSDAIDGLNWLGHGVGSFWTDYAPLSNTLDIFEQRPEHLHNDWLELLFEFGPIGFGLGCFFIAHAYRSGDGVSKFILAGFAAESLVGFPLHNPCTAFLAALCLGHLARDGADIRDLFHAGRVRLRAWHERYGLNWTASRSVKVERQGIPAGQAV